VRSRRELLSIRSVKKTSTVALLSVSVMVLTRADGGHELPIYPSFYPQEIRIETVDATAAARRLPTGELHAYLGEVPAFRAKRPDAVSYVETLGSYLVLTLQASPRAGGGDRCAAMETVVQDLVRAESGFVFHPYPITPYHEAYLHHADLAEAARDRYRSRTRQETASGPALRVRAKGAVAQALIPPGWRAAAGEGDAVLEEIEVAGLVASHMLALNGWLGPPWVKEGWFHAYLLFAGALGDAAREEVDALFARLRQGEHATPTDKLNLERALVRQMTRGCERLVVGYTPRRWYFNAEYSNGIENLGYDSLTGFRSPLFLRTVKLKDFPWNGWLRLGIDADPTAAWNPVAGFTDPAGSLVWLAVGDPALVPAPYGAGWVLNRIADVRSTREE